VTAITAPAQAAPETRRLRLPQYLGYSAGDAANNLAFSMTSMFLLLYYTDVVGISAAAVGTLFLVVRAFDAFADIFAGSVVDRSNTRWGKFRPFFLFCGVPLLLLSVATFTVPGGLSDGAKLAYAYITYALLGLLYSLVNIPYGSLASAMSQLPQERAKLAGFRMIGTAVTIIMLAFVVAPQIKGSSDLQRSLTITTLAFVVVGAVLYLFLFVTARENVQRDVAKVSFKQAVGTLRQNRPLMMLCLSALAFLTAMFSLQTVNAFYARDVLGDANYFITITLITTGAMFVMAPLVPKIVRTLGKKRGYIFSGLLGIVGGVGIWLAPASTPAISIIFFGVWGIALAVVNTLMFALEADTVEYGEWKTGFRTEGLTYALFSFTRKLGQAVGGAAAAYTIGLGGYIAGAEAQSEGAIDAIRWAAGLIPTVFIIIAVAIMAIYPLTEEKFQEIVRDVAARRAARVATAQETPE
jgi:glucuronide carrier protein